FLNDRYGLEALRQRRIKVSRINELNDPFELLAPSLSDRETRHGFTKLKNNLARTRGLLCFSKDWTNPVLWSHYADSHRGLCLGFSFAHEVIHVRYRRKRLRIKIPSLLSDPEKERIVMECLSTKFIHWQYEKEVRAFVNLAERDSNTGHYFFDFCESMTITHVIVGARSNLTRHEVRDALAEQSDSVRYFKARPAFKAFKLVPNRNGALWR